MLTPSQSSTPLTDPGMPYRNYLITTGILMLMLAAGYWGFDGSLRPVAQKDPLIIRQDADYFLVDAQ
ncbi:MAG: hypothetical protein ACPG5T_06255, partial [Endozoicomonas sp.]